MLTYIHVGAKEAEHSPVGRSTSRRGVTTGRRGGGTSTRRVCISRAASKSVIYGQQLVHSEWNNQFLCKKQNYKKTKTSVFCPEEQQIKLRNIYYYYCCYSIMKHLLHPYFKMKSLLYITLPDMFINARKHAQLLPLLCCLSHPSCSSRGTEKVGHPECVTDSSFHFLSREHVCYYTSIVTLDPIKI